MSNQIKTLQGITSNGEKLKHDMADRLALWLSASMDQHSATDEMRKHIRAWIDHQTDNVAAAAPMMPVAAQPVVPEGWQLVPTKLTDDMIVAFAEQWYSHKQVIDDPEMGDAYASMLAVAPSLEAQPAGEAVIMPQLLTPGMKSVLKEVAPKWNAESIYANLYDAAAMAQGEKP